ncbi:MAG: DUF3841 domain-containing protein [Faecalicatena sp.]|uniref:DUF3841 domain-containing protein n=1 Tax=Faecalicatena sp. TaxID=2005360 RepID=UPI002587A3A9|nr:DUF3841 domain-containing protein [Faecalicatena sp.]MCI6466561.1 DUF3841 domain-containing protein [Faecalicatena sp.]MDY5617936.1 DUF3841 domain-containing protein [Lachnospiraceae bacterium]
MMENSGTPGICHEENADRNRENKDVAEFMTMWTAQTDQVLETLERGGIYFVKKEYITQKYGNTAWIFQEAYRFFTERAKHIVPQPEEAQSPVWMFGDKKWAAPVGGGYRLELRIPREELILFDRRLWSKILNLSYIGTKEQETEFQHKLHRMGIADSIEVFLKPYYPLLKTEILKSWERLFTEACPELEYVQGAAWMIKKEWIV